MKELLKSVGATVLGICCLIAACLAVACIFGAAGWVTAKCLPVVASVAGVALLLIPFVFLPLAAFRRTRAFSAIAIVVCSFVFGLTLWMAGLLATLQMWGVFWAVVGLLFAGVGVVPMGIVAALFKGEWSILGALLFLLVCTYGSRLLGAKIAQEADRSAQVEAMIHSARAASLTKVSL